MPNITEVKVGETIVVMDERGESYDSPAPSNYELDIDPRIDLTKPIWEQAQRLWKTDAVDGSASAMLDALKPNLTTDDDAGLWLAVLRACLRDLRLLEDANELPDKQFLKIGSCSHWFRPHQSRWTAAGGFAWPSGWHGVSGFSRWGLPELDWSVLFERDRDNWKGCEKYSGKHRLEIRIAVPARTARHQQAAIHSIWTSPNQKVLYGFRKGEDVWKLAARSDFYAESEEPVDLDKV